jgi:cob(I)alamin adenosyltransferase
MAHIYTKHGDQGQSSLVGGERVNKNHPRLNAYGTIDELCSQLGFVLSLINQNQPELDSTKTALVKIQNELFQLSSRLACANSEMKKQLPSFADNNVHFLETEIDQMEKDLPKLKNFILPSGNQAASFLHIARTVCRRAEREIFTLTESDEEDQDLILLLKYTNRLSDFLFVTARWINYKSGIADQIWKA